MPRIVVLTGKESKTKRFPFNDQFRHLNVIITWQTRRIQLVSYRRILLVISTKQDNVTFQSCDQYLQRLALATW